MAFGFHEVMGAVSYYPHNSMWMSVGWDGKPKKNEKRKAAFLLPAFDSRAIHSVVSEFCKVAKRLQTLV